MLSLAQAVYAVSAMGAVILACRLAPFILFRGSKDRRILRMLSFIERMAPPVAMSVLALSAIAGEYRNGLSIGLYGTAASVCTVALHLWRRNALVSILGGTGVYIFLNYLL